MEEVGCFFLLPVLLIVGLLALGKFAMEENQRKIDEGLSNMHPPVVVIASSKDTSITEITINDETETKLNIRCKATVKDALGTVLTISDNSMCDFAKGDTLIQ
jgi:hypothetical protein